MRRRRRNFLRRSERQAFYRARRQGERYCFACASYHAPHQFTGSDPRTCDPCRGARRCKRCRQDQPITEFADADSSDAGTCRSCRGYRPLTAHEAATCSAFLAAAEHNDVTPSDDGVALGRDPSGRRVQLSATLRNRHLYILGNAGSGKTTLMKNLVLQDMAAGHGCAVVDLHGSLATDLLGLVPSGRLPVVTYFAPATGHGPTFNPLALPYQPNVVVEDMIDVFKTFFTDEWDAQVEHLLRFGLLTLLGDRTAHTLADLYTFFVAPPYRAALANASPSPRLRAFWEHELHSIDPGSIERIANKLAAFLTPLSPLERLFSIADNGLDFEAIMDGRQIFIANLSKETLGAEPARLLAAFLIRTVARARAERGRDARSDFFLYLPEFQDHAISSCDTLLSDFANSRIDLTFAHQRLGELPTGVVEALFAGVGTIAAFQVSPEDAVHLKREMCTRRLIRATTGELYDHDLVRRAAAAPIRARVRDLLANPRVFTDEELPNYQSARVDELLADMERIRTMPLPSDLTETDWPRIADFTDRKPLTAFVRIGQPDQVTALAVDAPPQPDANTRAKILDRPHRREPPARGSFDAKPAAPIPHLTKPRRRKP